MSNADIQQRTTVNIQEKANLIWAIADKIVGVYKPHEYGNVIALYQEKSDGKALSDFEFFSMLDKAKVKYTAAQIKLIRQYLGTKDAEYPEAKKKPADAKCKEYEFDSELTDTEIIPWQQDTDEYLEKNVQPYAPDYWVDESKTKIGYEIPFTREFYKYVAPRKSEDIFSHLKELESREAELMKKILTRNNWQ